MESYALKKVCDFENIPFICYKYITDECNKSSSNDWKNNIEKANKFYVGAMKEYENSSNR
jgi:adenosylhomocysteine nucleosidase